MQEKMNYFVLWYLQLRRASKETLKTQQVQFHSLPEQDKKVILPDSEKNVVNFVDYIYDHFDEFRLLIVCSGRFFL